MELMNQYLELVDQQQIIKDHAQLKIVLKLQQTLDRLYQGSRWLPTFLNRMPTFKSPPKGIFLWGTIGVGKTWLMDLFYNEVSGVKKKRYHYHEFMEMIHKRMAENKDQVNPLDIIAKELATDCRLLCLDEFNVPEIADAMLLHGVLKGLFKHKVMLVTTSNYSPDRLYENGFHRDIFLPTIELLKQHNESVEIETSTDYRIHNSTKTSSLEHLSQDIDDQTLAGIFTKLMTGKLWDAKELMINHRPVPALKVADGVIWLDYGEICGDPRATSDYLELSKMFDAVIISNIDPKLSADQSRARRFLHFVDELYDNQIKLVISEMGNLVHDYKNKTLKFQFARTISRLYEMQSLMVSEGYIEAPDNYENQS
ncbi:MAG: cell division protein ZapE [Pseudomonadota bacterium]